MISYCNQNFIIFLKLNTLSSLVGIRSRGQSQGFYLNVSCLMWLNLVYLGADYPFFKGENSLGILINIDSVTRESITKNWVFVFYFLHKVEWSYLTLNQLLAKSTSLIALVMKFVYLYPHIYNTLSSDPFPQFSPWKELRSMKTTFFSGEPNYLSIVLTLPYIFKMNTSLFYLSS